MDSSWPLNSREPASFVQVSNTFSTILKMNYKWWNVKIPIKDHIHQWKIRFFSWINRKLKFLEKNWRLSMKNKSKTRRIKNAHIIVKKNGNVSHRNWICAVFFLLWFLIFSWIQRKWRRSFASAERSLIGNSGPVRVDRPRQDIKIEATTTKKRKKERKKESEAINVGGPTRNVKVASDLDETKSLKKTPIKLRFNLKLFSAYEK